MEDKKKICFQVDQLLPEIVENMAGATEEIKSHLKVCSRCRELVQSTTKMLEKIKQVSSTCVTIPPDLNDSIITAVQNELNVIEIEKETAEKKGKPSAVIVKKIQSFMKFILPTVRSPVFATAAIVLIVGGFLLLIKDIILYHAPHRFEQEQVSAIERAQPIETQAEVKKAEEKTEEEVSTLPQAKKTSSHHARGGAVAPESEVKVAKKKERTPRSSALPMTRRKAKSLPPSGHEEDTLWSFAPLTKKGKQEGAPAPALPSPANLPEEKRRVKAALKKEKSKPTAPYRSEPEISNIAAPYRGGRAMEMVEGAPLAPSMTPPPVAGEGEGGGEEEKQTVTEAKMASYYDPYYEAMDLLRRGETRQAESLLKLIVENPSRTKKSMAEVSHLLAKALVKNSKLNEAASTYEKIVKNYPKYRKINSVRWEAASVYIKISKRERARQLLKQLLNDPKWKARAEKKLKELK